MERLKGLRPAHTPWEIMQATWIVDPYMVFGERLKARLLRHNLLVPKPPPAIKPEREMPNKPLWQQMNRHIGKRR